MVAEGSSATIVATLSAALGSDVVIPVTVTRGSAEAGDIGTLTSITVAQGFTVGGATITTAQDTDADHETFTVSLGTPLPSSVSAGTPSSVTVTVQDDEATRDSLVGLSLTVGGSAVTLSPAFATSTKSYTGTVAPTATSASVTPTWIEGHFIETKVASTTPDYDSILTQSGSALASSGTSKTVTLAASGDTWVSVEIRDNNARKSTNYLVVLKKSTQSSNANLSALTAKSSTDGSTFTALTLSPSTFSASTTAYTASVANGVTHVKLTPTKAHTGASIKVGKGTSLTAVNSGTDSSAIALSEGSNAIKVEVTAQDGTTKVAYTVTVTRAASGTLSSNANLSALTAKSSTDVTTFTALTLSPSPFSASTTAYTASVANNVTHVKLTPTKAHTGASIKVGKGTSLTAVNSGSDSSAILLSEGANAIKVEVTAEDGTTKVVYTVTVTRAASTPPATTPTVSLSAAPNPVAEGSPVTVTATLSAALTGAVSIPVTVTLGTAEAGDIGTLASIAITGGSTTGTGTITTAQDDDTEDETFTVSLGTLPSSVSAGAPNSVTVRIADDDAPGRTPVSAGPSAGLVLSVAPGDGALALTWNRPWGPNHIYEVQWKVSSAPDADATAPGDPSTGWVAPGRARVVNGVPQTVYATGTAYTIRGLANGTAYDARVRPYAYPHETPVRWSTGAGTPRAPAPPASLTLSVDPVALAHGGAVTVTARLDAPAQKAMDVWFDTAGDGGAARWGPDCAWEHGTADMVAAGEREATVKLCATAAGAGRTMTVTAGTHDPALTAAGVKVRVQGPNPPTALVVEADPQAVAAGGTVTVTVRLDRPSAPGMTVHLGLNGVGAASWGACGGTAAARTLPSPITGYGRVEIPPGGREATAKLCVLRGGRAAPGASRVFLRAAADGAGPGAAGAGGPGPARADGDLAGPGAAGGAGRGGARGEEQQLRGAGAARGGAGDGEAGGEVRVGGGEGEREAGGLRHAGGRRAAEGGREPGHHRGVGAEGDGGAEVHPDGGAGRRGEGGGDAGAGPAGLRGRGGTAVRARAHGRFGGRWS